VMSLASVMLVFDHNLCIRVDSWSVKSCRRDEKPDTG
jgi:hypothetical protein